MYLFFPSSLCSKKKRKRKSRRLEISSFIIKAPPRMTRIFSFLSKCFSDFWCKSVLVRRSELMPYPRKKNEKSRDNTPAQYHHRRHCIHHINIFTTKRKENTDKNNNKNKNKNKNNQHSELFKCDQRYVSKFRRRVLLETRRAVAAAKARAVLVMITRRQSLGHHHHHLHHRRGGIRRGGGGERNVRRRRRPQSLTMRRRRRSPRKIR